MTIYEIDMPDFGHIKRCSKRLDKCFDGKVINISPKYGELVASADNGGLIAVSLNLENRKPANITANSVRPGKPIMTSWAEMDVFSYSNSKDFSVIINDYENVSHQYVIRTWSQ